MGAGLKMFSWIDSVFEGGRLSAVGVMRSSTTAGPLRSFVADQAATDWLQTNGT